MGILNNLYLRKFILKDAPWMDSHGATHDYAGLGLLYYALVYILRPKICVCLGSGGAFVPRIIRQAQRDLGIAKASKTILVDGNLPEKGWGKPKYLNKNSFFRKNFPDVKIIIRSTKDAAKLFKNKKIKIDYLHIDADHSYKGSFSDYKIYKKLMNDRFIITFHDTRSCLGVRKTINEMRSQKDVDVIDFNEFWCGFAIVKPRKAPPLDIFQKEFDPNYPCFISFKKIKNKFLAKSLPIKVMMLANNKVKKNYSSRVFNELKGEEIDVEMDTGSNFNKKKIQGYISKGFDYIIVIGDKEGKNETVSILNNQGKKNSEIKLNDFLKRIKKCELENKIKYK